MKRVKVFAHIYLIYQYRAVSNSIYMSHKIPAQKVYCATFNVFQGSMLLTPPLDIGDSVMLDKKPPAFCGGFFILFRASGSLFLNYIFAISLYLDQHLAEEFHGFVPSFS